MAKRAELAKKASAEEKRMSEEAALAAAAPPFGLEDPNVYPYLWVNFLENFQVILTIHRKIRNKNRKKHTNKDSQIIQYMYNSPICHRTI